MMRVLRVGFDALLLEFADSTRVRAAYLQADADRRSGTLEAIDLVPGEKPGETELIVRPGTGKRWHVLVTGDNADRKSVV